MEKEIRIDVFRCLKMILNKWYIVFGVATIFGAVMFGIKFDSVQIYRAYTTIYSASYGSYSATTESMKAVQLYSEIVTSSKIASRAVSIMGNSNITTEDVKSMIYVDYSEDSPVLGIGASSTNPTIAVDVANAVAQAFVIEASNITGNTGVQILDEAKEAHEISNGVKLYTVLAFVAGFLLAACVIAFMEIVSDRVYHVKDAELDGEIEIIGVIPNQSIR